MPNMQAQVKTTAQGDSALNQRGLSTEHDLQTTRREGAESLCLSDFTGI